MDLLVQIRPMRDSTKQFPQMNQIVLLHVQPLEIVVIYLEICVRRNPCRKDGRQINAFDLCIREFLRYVASGLINQLKSPFEVCV